MDLVITSERPGDSAAIRQVTNDAFASSSHPGSGNEAAIVDALRRDKALALSLVAIIDDRVAGHVAFSAVCIDGSHDAWFGLAPLSVRRDLHRRGVGTALVREGLRRLRALGGRGCVVLGDLGYYGRFGFECDPGLRYHGAPAEYFMRLSLDGSAASGTVSFHQAFSRTA